MPLKFVSHRWMENVPVCERALLIIQQVTAYVRKIEEKQLSKPSCKSYEVVATKLKDKLLIAELEFFRYIAMYLLPFLGNYQTDRPIIPFMMSDLSSVIKGLVQIIVKPQIIQAAQGSKLFSVDLDDEDTFVTYSKVEIGFSTEKALKQAVKDKKVSDRQVLEFRLECKGFVVKVLKKLLEKCPVTYALVRNLSVLDPREMASKGNACKSKLKKVLSHLVSCDKVQKRDCDEVIRQYTNFIDCAIPTIGTEKFSGFIPNKDRVDEFLSKAMCEDGYHKLLEVVKICLVLSHGQATVERGFSINKEVETENLKEQSITAQRLICDYVKSVGGVLKVKITKELLQSASLARQKYDQYLAKEKESKTSDAQKRKRKCLEDSIADLKKQAKQAKLDYDSLNKAADDYAVKAEKERDFSHIAKSNALREKSKEKSLLCIELESKISEKVTELKSC